MANSNLENLTAAAMRQGLPLASVKKGIQSKLLDCAAKGDFRSMEEYISISGVDISSSTLQFAYSVLLRNPDEVRVDIVIELMRRYNQNRPAEQLIKHSLGVALARVDVGMIRKLRDAFGDDFYEDAFNLTCSNFLSRSIDKENSGEGEKYFFEFIRLLRETRKAGELQIKPKLNPDLVQNVYAHFIGVGNIYVVEMFREAVGIEPNTPFYDSLVQSVCKTRLKQDN